MINQDICNDILRYGVIVSDSENNFPDGLYRTYQIEYKQNLYVLTKRDGVWIYPPCKRITHNMCLSYNKKLC